MKNLGDLIITFARGIAHSRIALIGAMLVTALFPFLLGALLYDAIWDMRNTYFAALAYLILGPMVILGLVLVFLGLFFFRGKEDVRLFTLSYLRDYFSNPERFNRLRKLLFFFVFISGTMLCIFGVITYRSYNYMNSTGFCTEFCHMVLKPQKVAHMNSPHSQVECVACHFGTNAKWFEKAKISGLQQVANVLGHGYSTPIETPLRHLRPSREDCEECHRPALFHGDKLSVREKYRADRDNTSIKTVLLLKIGSAGDRSVSPHGYHWHVAPENRLIYTALGEDRKVIPEIRFKESDDPATVFKTADADQLLGQANLFVETREMDCMDCHNRPAHHFLSADEAIDLKILSGEIPHDLPYIKKQAMELVTRTYASQQEALTKIAAGLRTWYRQNYPEIGSENKLVEKAVLGVQDAYRENVFPWMQIDWGTYIDHIGHGEKFDRGCFRCHDGKHFNGKGEPISSDCDTCHVLLSEEDPDPEILEILEGR